MTDSFQTPSAGFNRQKLILRLAGFAIVVAVAFLKPRIDSWLNNNSVAEASTTVNTDASQGDLFDQQLDSSPSGLSLDDLAASSQTTQQKTQTQPSHSRTSQAGSPSTKAGKLDSKLNPDRNRPNTKQPEKTSPPTKAKLGTLKLVKGTRDEFLSTAGLFYGPGSADGHRLKHVLKHAKDNKTKPVHGIFSGDREQILEWIDVAYQLAQKGGRGVRKKNQNDRTVYIVDLGKPIGKMGGQVGARKNFPSCRYLQLVLEDGNHVVTAYPTNRF